MARIIHARNLMVTFLVRYGYVLALPLAAAVLAVWSVTPTGAVSSTLVISQFYVTGGICGPSEIVPCTAGTPATFTNNYIELHNVSSVPQSLGGLSLQISNSAAVFGNDGLLTFIDALPNVIIPPGGFFLMQGGAGGTENPLGECPGPSHCGGPLPAADFVAPSAFRPQPSRGKLALVSGTTPLACGGVLNDCFPGGVPIARIIDFVGWGGGPITALPNNCESLAAASTAGTHQCAAGFGARGSNTINVLAADFRNSNGIGDGCQDSDNNLANFTQRPAAPRNSASPPALCVAVSTPTTTPTRTPTPTVTPTRTPLTTGGHDLRLISQGGNQVRLEWAAGTGQTGYRLSRMTSAGNFVVASNLGPTATNFTDTLLAGIGVACYQLEILVQSPSGLGLSDVLCVIVNVAGGTAAPRNVAITANDADLVTIRWDAPSSGTQIGYLVVPLGRTALPPVPATATQVNDTQGGEGCYIVLTLVPDGGQFPFRIGGFSDIVCAVLL